MRQPNSPFEREPSTGQLMSEKQVDEYIRSTKGSCYLFANPLAAKDDPSEQYTGYWSTGVQEPKRHGLGELKFSDGKVYRGMFQNGKIRGRGRMEYPDGSIYQGEFSDGQRQGKGKFVETDGTCYTGTWEDDRMHGEGVLISEQGSQVYVGAFAEGKMDGKGRIDWADGSYYEGDFVEGLYVGEGTHFEAARERLYEGQFAEGHFEGRGKLVYKDGATYSGDFSGGKRSGQGTLDMANGNRYIGAWRDDQQHGVGIFVNAAEGTKRQGEWKQGHRAQWLNPGVVLNGIHGQTLSPMRGR